MNSIRIFLAAAVLLPGACATTPKVLVSDQDQGLGVVLNCPEGSREIGLGPPDGTSVRCMRDVSGVPQAHGPEMVWHSNGQKMHEGRNDQGLRQGMWISYSPAGKKTREATYVRGQLQGKDRHYNAGGALSAEYTYVNDKRHGPSTNYYPTGGLAEQSMYADDALHGESTTFYQNGGVAAKGDYSRGVRSGLWAFWYSNNKLCMRGRMLKDERDGYWSHQTAADTDVFARFRKGVTQDAFPGPEICR